MTLTSRCSLHDTSMHDAAHMSHDNISDLRQPDPLHLT